MKQTQFRPLLCFAMASTLCLSLAGASLAGGSDFVPSTEASRNAHVVNKGMHWFTSLEEAQSAAKKDGKLVLWIHMLGTIDGAT